MKTILHGWLKNQILLNKNPKTNYFPNRLQQSSLQDEQTLSLIDATDEIANPSSHDPLQTDPNLQGSDVKSTLEISSTTNPFYESNERPGMENYQGITSSAPSYPMYESLSERLRSFSNWPNHMTQTPHEMASAGFFYKGYGDFTQCFFCGGGLKEWEAGDDPLVSSLRCDDGIRTKIIYVKF